MTTFNKDMMYTAGAIILGIGTAFGLILGSALNGNRPSTPTFDESSVMVIEESRWTPTTGAWITTYHATYDDGKYIFEASDYSRAAAVAAVRNMVLA